MCQELIFILIGARVSEERAGAILATYWPDGWHQLGRHLGVGLD